MRLLKQASLLVAAMSLLMLYGCGDVPTALSDDLTEPVFRVVKGDNQTGAVGQELSEVLVAKLTDKDGDPRVGYTVNWVIVEGGGSVWAPATVTDDKGKTKNRWTLGLEPGTNVVEVRSMAPNGNKRRHGTFTATGVLPPDEVCNGSDDDFDGEIDEGLDYCIDGSPAPNTDGEDSCLFGWEDENEDPTDGCELAIEPVLYGMGGLCLGPNSCVQIRHGPDVWELRAETGFNWITGIDVAPDGTLYGIANPTAGTVLITIDPVSGFGTEVGPTEGADFEPLFDVSVRNDDGVLFTLGRTPVEPFFCTVLGTVDLNTGLATWLGQTGTCGGYPSPNKRAPLAFSLTGDLYFVEQVGNELYTLDQSSGIATQVASLSFEDFPGLTNPVLTSFDFHRITGILYAAVRDGNANYLATVNTSTGVVTYVETLPTGMEAIAWR